ncbi:LysR family transcriptional regulator [Legionella sp. CNM-4043-24]|uniref:LysR family transcriptional regulator n=1 Tax=Legionella sp. CNM-4043-24 TaxID=3421646 RepID=UPI00403AA6D2
MDIKNLNLNLLRALYALLSCRHVTNAGRQAGVSQSSMSISLKQLREFFSDELIVPGQGNRMQLTPLGANLIGPVREAMATIDKIFSFHNPFNPLTDKRVFQIGMTDMLSFLLLPALIKSIETIAPNIKLIIRSPRYLTSTEVFESGELDLMVGLFEGVPSSLKQQSLFSDEVVIVGRQGHPAFENNTISIESILQYPLIQMAICDTPFQNYFDRFLSSQGYNKRVSVLVGQGISPLQSLPGTNYLSMSIRRVVEKLNSQIPLQFAPAPFDTGRFVCYQYWHPKNDDDAAHQWLRTLIKKLSDR